MDWWDNISMVVDGAQPRNYVEVNNGYDNNGFNYGPFSTEQYGGSSMPDGGVTIGQKANDSSWFDQSSLKAGFQDILQAGVGAFKSTIAQEGRGGQPGKSILDTFYQAGLDQFSSSKTGQQFRAQVVQSQMRLLFQNPVTWVALTAVGIGLIVMLRK